MGMDLTDSQRGSQRLTSSSRAVGMRERGEGSYLALTVLLLASGGNFVLLPDSGIRDCPCFCDIPDHNVCDFDPLCCAVQISTEHLQSTQLQTFPAAAGHHETKTGPVDPVQSVNVLPSFLSFDPLKDDAHLFRLALRAGQEASTQRSAREGGRERKELSHRQRSKELRSLQEKGQNRTLQSKDTQPCEEDCIEEDRTQNITADEGRRTGRSEEDASNAELLDGGVFAFDFVFDFTELARGMRCVGLRRACACQYANELQIRRQAMRPAEVCR
eukprot:1419826-Rhodomonas_salina.2